MFFDWIFVHAPLLLIITAIGAIALVATERNNR